MRISQHKSVLFVEQNGDVLQLVEFSGRRENADVRPTIAINVADLGDSQRVRDRLRDANVGHSKVVLLIPRRFVSLRVLTLPNLSDSELTAAIPLQAESQLGRSLDTTCFDFLTIHQQNATQKYAVFASAQREPIEQLCGQLAAAGLKVDSVLVPELIHDSTAPETGNRADVYFYERHAELCLSLQGCPVAGISLRTSDDPLSLANSVVSALERLQSGLPPGLATLRPECLHLHQLSETRVDLEQLRHSLPESLQTGAYHSREELYRSAMSALSDRAGRIDLLATRVHNSSQREQVRNWLRVAVCLIVGLLLFSGWILQEHTSLDRSIADLTQEAEELQLLVERGQVILETDAAVRAWRQQNIDWAEEVIELSSQLPARDRLYLSRLQADIAPQSGEAILRVSGKAKSSADVTALNTHLASQRGRYEMSPASIQPTNYGERYAARFDIESRIVRDAQVQSTKPTDD